MDPMIRWGIRLAQWYRHPPSRQRLIVMAVVIVACLAALAIERIFGWPSWLTTNGRLPHSPRIH
ncbi:MAG: hypothetical protein JWR10_2546 [Rubritepida sp.]|nr:hypothetical protein [Rubritepida sp.]